MKKHRIDLIGRAWMLRLEKEEERQSGEQELESENSEEWSIRRCTVLYVKSSEERG